MMRFVALLALAAVLGAECRARLRTPVGKAKAKLEAKIQSLQAKIASADSAINSTKVEIAKTHAVVQHAHEQITRSLAVANKTTAPSKPKAPKKNLTDVEKLGRLETGLDSIDKLRSLFTEKKAGPADGAEKFATGAMSQELEKKDSAIWGMISNMIAATKNTTKMMQGKNKTAQAALMDSLETNLNQKAEEMSNITDQVTAKQEKQNEEYMLGLLNMHKNNWNMTEQVQAVERMADQSPVLLKLLKHHDDKKPLADQLAVLMDASPKNATKATKKAAKMFIQLASSLN